MHTSYTMKALLKKVSLIRLQMFAQLMLPLALLVMLFMPLTARAQAADAGTSDASVITDGLQTVVHTAQDPTKPKYLIVVAVVLVLCQLFKRFGHRIPMLGTWLLNHTWGDWIVGVGLSISGALLSSVTVGHGPDLGLIISALVTGMAASGTPMAIFGVSPGVEPLPSAAPAQAAGTAGAKDPGTPLNS